ncbi:error-prone DNA polymerase [Solicola sp. PLA-1-18]|uniref:error-prone DNA polymerase n=1 Tax=Solicola sp. PLA-1-18 TaxID=3380532 RepID=UPI003B7CA2E1
MGFNNPDMSWKRLESILSGTQKPDGGDGPAWSRKREAYEAPEPPRRPAGTVPYAELHCHSSFSFLDGASEPSALVEEATRLGLEGLAITDHDGLYGVVRMAEAAAEHQMPTVIGAELSLDLTAPQNGVADPEGSHLLVLARREEGYHRLAGAITDAQLAGAEKGRPRYDLEALGAAAGDGHWHVLTGCRKGAVRQALVGAGYDAAGRELDRLVDLFGRDHVTVELHHHGGALDSTHDDALAALAAERRLPVVATGNVHAARPSDARLAAAVAAVRARRSLDAMDGWLPGGGPSYLRSGEEMAARFARWPGAVARSVELARELAFDLQTARPRLPQNVPDGLTPMEHLRALVAEGATRYYDDRPDALERLERELAVIEEKDFPGYFLIVHDIAKFARDEGIAYQGRGSAANSAVCYALGITAIDSIFFDLPFERFLAATRDEEPDIDVDFDAGRREEVIQWVYRTYGRRNAAQVANVITYRPKSAVRDMAKALGHSTGQQDAWSKQVDAWGSLADSLDHDIPAPVVALAEELSGAPRHLGIHSGGMVLTDRPVGTVVPVEHARMENRTVLQWDKDDCAWMGLVKFDLLGLGMLGAMQRTLDMVAEHLGERWTLQDLPKEEAGVYDMLCRADSVGVFQVESRAQMGTLPRLHPRRFYDLVIEIALIRPGPIQGGAVHPYIRRKLGEEPISYLHPALEPVLERTLGVPLFQEQLMQIAMAVGGCSGDDADLLRRAMGSKRGVEKIARLRATLYAGMESHGITGDLADDIYAKIEAFANFGFAESHSLSFGLLVYASSWLKLHYPGAFLAALLASQPMGFYSPQTLTADARRHGVEVLRPDLARSQVQADLEPLTDASTVGGDPACVRAEQPPVPTRFDPDGPFSTDDHRRDAAYAVRQGLADITSISVELAERIVAERDAHGAFASLADLTRRIRLTTPQVEALATAGAFACFGLGRREALWAAGQAGQERPEHLPGTAVYVQPPLLPEMSPAEETMADLWATTVSPQSHPMEHVRTALDARGVLTVGAMQEVESGTRVRVGGVVTHRQRPATAAGVTFLNLEDETGMLNVVCSVGLWGRHRRVARDSKALVVRGILERRGTVTNLLADHVETLPITARTTSRDFH